MPEPGPALLVLCPLISEDVAAGRLDRLADPNEVFLADSALVEACRHEDELLVLPLRLPQKRQNHSEHLPELASDRLRVCPRLFLLLRPSALVRRRHRRVVPVLAWPGGRMQQSASRRRALAEVRQRSETRLRSSNQ